MKSLLFLSGLFTAFFIPASMAAEAPETLTLSQAYASALARSEDIGLAKEEIEAARGRFYQAFDTVLPDVDFVLQRTEQDAPEQVSTTDSVTALSLRRTTPLGKFTVNQPLFSGFKEVAGLQAAGADREQYVHRLKRAKQTLFVEVAEAFYGLWRNRRDQEIVSRIRGILEKRVEELSRRVAIGRSRESELQSALVEMKNLEADEARAFHQARISGQLLEFYIGRNVPAGLDDGIVPPPPAEPDAASYRQKALLRPDVRAAGKASALAEKNVIVAQAGLFPKVSLESNFYTERVGSQSGVDWDYLIKLEVPVFDRLNTIGDIRLAATARNAAQLREARSKRLAELEIRNAWEAFAASVHVRAMLAEAASAAEKNYALHEQDFQKNLIDGLDVLESLRQYQSALRSLNDAETTARTDYWKFKAAAGEIET